MQHNNSLAVMLFDKKFIANSFRSFLKCPSCRNDFSAFFQQDRSILGGHTRSSRPILLSCGHSMCENCVQQNYKNLVCPECSRPLPVPQHLWNNFKFRKFFEMNFFLVGAIRHLSYYRCDGLCDSSVLLGSESDKRIDRKSKKNNFALKCGECEESSAVGTCSQCNVNYCKKCFEKVLMNSKVLKSHFLNQFDAQQSKVRFHKPRPKQCHRQTCDRYCNKCRNTYCRNCIKSDHLTHGNISLLERNENRMDDIFAVLEAVKQSRENTRKAQRNEMLAQKNKKLHNDLMDSEGKIRVFCRVRPVLSCEKEKLLCDWNFSEETTIKIVNPHLKKRNKPVEQHTFLFDHVFNTECEQDEIFEHVSPFIQSAMDGYNICIFAYGQTGSGKTYTMHGTDSNIGVIPRTVESIFESIEKYRRLGWNFTVKATFLEIYNDIIYDLLSKKKKEIVKQQNKFYVKDITAETVLSADHLRELMNISKTNRITAATIRNEHSSRSHAVTKIELIGNHAGKNETSIGTVNLVDLAGSESPETSERMEETKKINKSLHALTNVIRSLLENNDIIPYRESKLTQLLSPAFGEKSLLRGKHSKRTTRPGKLYLICCAAHLADTGSGRTQNQRDGKSFKCSSRSLIENSSTNSII